MIAPKRTKELGINLTEEVKDLCTEKFKTLMRERQKSMEIYPMSMDWKNTVKMFIVPKAITIKIAMAFFTEVEKNNSKICVELQKLLNSQSNFEKRTKLEATHFMISNYITTL